MTIRRRPYADADLPRLRAALAGWRREAGPWPTTRRGATMDDAERLAAVRNSAFDAGWSAAAFREQVIRKPGYRPERELRRLGMETATVQHDATNLAARDLDRGSASSGGPRPSVPARRPAPRPCAGRTRPPR